MTYKLIISTLLILIATSDGNSSATYQDAQKLERYILSNYSQSVRPLLNQSETMTVTITFLLDGVLKVDDIEQTITTNAVYEVRWTDELLKWDPDKFGGIGIVNIPEEKRWLPRIMITNSVNERDLLSGESSPYEVLPDGSVIWTPATVVTTFCALDMTHFPFDEQSCDINILPIDFTQNQLKLVTNTNFSTTRTRQNGEWSLKDISGTDGNSNAFSKVNVKLTLTRRPTFILLNVYLPIVILSFLNAAVFAVPVDSGEKLSYVLTVLLSLAVLMSTVSGMLPTTSTHTPYITIYLSCLIVISTLSVLMTVLIIRVHHRGLEHSIPPWLYCVTRLVERRSMKRNQVTDAVPVEKNISWECVGKGLNEISLYISTCVTIIMCTILILTIYYRI